jgi:hypothetical protein
MYFIEMNALFSKDIMNRPAVVMQVQCPLYEARAEIVNSIQINFILQKFEQIRLGSRNWIDVAR